MQRGLAYGLAIFCLGCFSVSRAGKLESVIQLLIEKLKIDLKEDSSSIRDEIANLRDDVSNQREDLSNLRDGQSDIRDNIFEMMKQFDGRTNDNTVKNDTEPKSGIPLFTDGCNKSATMFQTIQDQLKNFRQNCPKDASSHSHPVDAGDTLKEDLDAVKEQLEKLVDTCTAVSDDETYRESCNNATLPVAEDCSGQSDGLLIILTKRGNEFLARCEAGWLVIAHRYDGSVDFNQAWDDYKHGFGIIWKEHFLGFENIVSVLLQKRYKARFELTPWENETRFAEYQTFDINDEKDKYRISIDGYSGTAGDSMKYSNHMRFSTIESDNDNDSSRNCAKYFGPYWYDKCGGIQASIFGIYSKIPQCSSWACLTWYNWPEKLPGVQTNAHYSFKEVKLKIRPI